jgi:serine/threonine-protein kinase
VLPFGKAGGVTGVAVDSAGTVYAAFGAGPVLALTAGATAPVQLPFDGPVGPGVAADSQAVYATANTTLWKLPSGSNTPATVSFAGLTCGETPMPLNIASSVAVDKAGAVYVADFGGCPGGRVMMLAPGATAPTALPFTDLGQTGALAVDDGGSVYVSDLNSNRVLKLEAGASRETALPFTGLRQPHGLAVSATGDLYVSDSRNDKILELAAGSSTPNELSISGLRNPQGLALDGSGNLYIADAGNGRVLKIPVG